MGLGSQCGALTHCRLFQKELEAAWGVQVFDRFTVVLHIFRCNARTREARLQVALAELPVLRCGLDTGPPTSEPLCRPVMDVAQGVVGTDVAGRALRAEQLVGCPWGSPHGELQQRGTLRP